MISKLIKLGVENILNIICEKIIIRNILVVNKNNKFSEIIEELYIKAESIIYNKINISKLDIKISDLVLRLSFKNKKSIIEDAYALINMRLTRDNITKTLSNKKWKSLKNSIESFISMSFQSVEIYDNSIYFISADGLSNKNIDYNLQYDINSISLVNNINQEKLSILNDKNISVKNLFFCENYIELEIGSKIIIN
tara:strand:+ start:204 stop:791 length:588 start_codon:yes stop_codon:yes gene_type:complete